jgi:hypothetical protein
LHRRLQQIELRIGEEASVIIPLCEDDKIPVAPEEQITL